MKAPVKSNAKDGSGRSQLELGFLISVGLTGFWIGIGQVVAFYFRVKISELTIIGSRDRKTIDRLRGP